MDYSRLNPGDVIQIKDDNGTMYELFVVSVNVGLGLVYAKDGINEYVINWLKNNMRLLLDLVDYN